jgi:hypothetical protein
MRALAAELQRVSGAPMSYFKGHRHRRKLLLTVGV